MDYEGSPRSPPVGQKIFYYCCAIEKVFDVFRFVVGLKGGALSNSPGVLCPSVVWQFVTCVVWDGVMFERDSIKRGIG